ncbi:MAG TPA: VOC family protein [Gaiellaceae bacterium]|nr:VOC family protein [Gaiellaceae bacterium]
MRIAQIALASADPAAQADFWGGRLGLPVRESGDAVEVVLQRSTIRFEPADDGIDPRYHFAINVPPGSIEDAAAWLGSRHEILEFHDDPDVEEGATIVRGDRGGLSFYFLDGGGSVVELMANPRIDDDLEGQFGPDSLLEIAEIGVASADTAATRAAIEETFGADVLWGGREAWRLTAIGDDHGVVIVSPVGRGWIPVGLPAEPLPTTIVAEGRRPKETTLPEGPYRLQAI